MLNPEASDCGYQHRLYSINQTWYSALDGFDFISLPVFLSSGDAMIRLYLLFVSCAALACSSACMDVRAIPHESDNGDVEITDDSDYVPAGYWIVPYYYHYWYDDSGDWYSDLPENYSDYSLYDEGADDFSSDWDYDAWEDQWYDDVWGDWSEDAWSDDD